MKWAGLKEIEQGSNKLIAKRKAKSKDTWKEDVINCERIEWIIENGQNDNRVHDKEQ